MDPNIYEEDLRQIVHWIDELKLIEGRVGESFMTDARIVIYSRNEYEIGTIINDGDQWAFIHYTAYDQAKDGSEK